MIKENDLPLEMWGEAIKTWIYVLNTSPTKGLDGLVEKWTSRKAKYCPSKSFGSLIHGKTDNMHL